MKDLLAYNMLNEPNEEILTRINKLLNLKGKDLDNTNAKNILKKLLIVRMLFKKKNIMKQIEAENKSKNEIIVNNNNINKNNKLWRKKNKINENSSITEGNDNKIETGKKNNTVVSSKPVTNTLSNSNISTINVSKEQKDLLLLENAGIKKDNELYKTKLLSIEKELRNNKLENSKLKNVNATSF